MIKNIVFDIGMVLVDFRWQAMLKELGYSEEDIRWVGERTVNHPVWSELDHGIMDPEAVKAQMRQAVAGKEEVYDALWAHEAEMVRPYPGNREWLTSLRERGYRIYLLSNYPKSMFDLHAKEAFDFMDLVDGKIVSAYVKKIKPHADIYECLLETYGLLAEECVFLDDRSANVEAAMALGFAGVVVQNREQAQRDLERLLG